MFVVQECRHFIDRVTIQALETTRRIAHSDDTIVDNISEIKAEIFIDKASSSAADKFAKGLYHLILFYGIF